MKKQHLSWRFMLSSAIMNSLFAPATAYATIYLTSKGFFDQQVGFILAASNLLTIALQNWLGKRIDRDENWTLLEYNLLLVIPGALLAFSMLFTSRWLNLLAIQFMLVAAFVGVVSPLLNSISVMFMNQGYTLNYGLGRAGGSIGFAVVSWLLGRLLTVYDPDVIVITMGVLYVLYGLSLFSMPIRQVAKDADELAVDDTLATDSIKQETHFMKRYPHYPFVFIGTILFFMFHNLLMAYLIRFVNFVGGNEDTMGTALMIQALIEIPILVAYVRLRRYLSDKKWLFIAGLGYTVKAIVLWLATSVTGIYLGMALQILGYPLYVVAALYYVQGMTSQADQTEGQVSIMTAQTIGTILGTLAGGWLIGLTTIPMIHLFNVVICCLGLVCLWIGLFVKDKNTV